MALRHRGMRTIYGLVGSIPAVLLGAWWLNHEPPPGSEGGDGPLSPSGLYAQAVRESERGERAATERHLRMALTLCQRPTATPGDRRLEPRIRNGLARVLAARGARDEAREIAAPVCRSGPDGAAPQDLVSAGLCEQ